MFTCRYGRKDVVKLLLDQFNTVKGLTWIPEITMEGLHLCFLAKMDTKMLSKLLLDHSSSKNIDLNARDIQLRNCSTVDSWFSHLGKLYPNGLALGFDWPIVRVSRFFGWHLPSSSFYYYAESLSNSSLSWKRPNEMHELGSLGRWPCDVWSEGRHIFPPFCIMASNEKIDHEESADWTSSSIKAYFLRESLTFTLTTRSHEELLLHLHSG